MALPILADQLITMNKIVLFVLFCAINKQSFCWGFYAHQRINYYALFLLPPEMMVLYKPNIQFLTDHAVDPDKRRYAVAAEAPKHYIDIDHYGHYPWQELLIKNEDCLQKYS